MLLSLAACNFASAEPLVISLSDGRTLHEAEVTEQDEAFLTIRHATGVARVPLALLPPEIKRAIGYDPLKAARKLAEERRLIEAQEAERVKRREMERRVQGKIFIRGMVREMRSGGYAVMDATRYGETEEKFTRFEPAKIGQNWKPQKKEVERTVTREIRMHGVLVVGVPANLQPGQTWSGDIWPAGETQNKNEAGAVTSMQTRYATSPELAALLMEEQKQKAIEALRSK